MQRFIWLTPDIGPSQLVAVHNILRLSDRAGCGEEGTEVVLAERCPDGTQGFLLVCESITDLARILRHEGE
jgi:hypothetical protein